MKKLVLSAALMLLAAPAMAHSGHGAFGLMAGLAHPLTGADHLLAMLAVGLWSGFVLPRHIWAGAATFVLARACHGRASACRWWKCGSQPRLRSLAC